MSFSGYFQGSVTVLDANGNPTYVATWPGGTSPNLSAGPINYTESCGVVAPLPPVFASAGGPFTISGGVLSLNGQVVGTATLQGSFGWERIGVGVAIGTNHVSLLNGATTVATTSGVGDGVGVFGVPVGPVGSLPPSCANPVPVTVAVAGTYAQPS